MKCVNVVEASGFKLHSLAVALRTASVAVLAASSAQVLAEDAAVLQKVVVSAAGYEQKITDAPSSISVITQEELHAKPYATLLDAVRELEGVDIGETRDKTGQGTISMRGMGSDYTLFLINGKRQNNHGDIYPNSFGGNQFGHIPPLDAIERIEVIRGPASTLYGADAMGGVINIITKKVTDKWMGSVTHSRTLESRDEYGSDVTTDFSVMGPLIKGKLGLAVRGSIYDRNGSKPTYDSYTDPLGTVRQRSLGFGGGGKTVDNTNESIGGTLTFTPTVGHSIAFDIDSSNQEYDNTPVLNDAGEYEYPVGVVDSMANSSVWRTDNYCDGATATSNAACTTAGGVWTKRASPRVGYRADQEFTRDSWALTWDGKWDWGNSWLSLSHVETNNNGRTLPFSVEERKHLLAIIDPATGTYTGLDGTVYNYTGMSEADRKAAAEALFMPRPDRKMQSSQFVLDAKVDIPYELAGDHVAVLGSQVIRGELEDSVFGLESGKPNQVQEHNMWSVFAEDTWYIVEPFALTVGLRYDDHEVFGDHLSPRVYGVYTINPEWTLKGGVATGFKTPKTTDLYDVVKGFGGQGTSPQFGNPDLKPETSTSTELAIYWQHPRGHNFNATVFHNQFDDKISSQDCGSGTSLTCSSSGDYADLGYASSTKTVNIDEVVIQGLELAARWQFATDWALRGNYTLTDSEQKSGEEKGLPLGNAAKHMANITLDWQIVERFNMFLTTEMRGDRYRGLHVITDEKLYYKDYAIMHLGASFKANDNVTFNFRINNFLDQDFTDYKTEFRDIDGDGNYVNNNANGNNEVLFFDDYNNKEKRRSLWAGINVKF